MNPFNNAYAQSLVERDGTGCTKVERDGTGISTVDTDGTGITKGRRAGFLGQLMICATLAMLCSVSAFADSLNLKGFDISIANGNATIIWQHNGEIYAGRAPVSDNYSVVVLSAIPLDSSYFQLGARDMDSVARLLADSSGTGIDFDADKSADSSGTGDNSRAGKSADSSGTGDKGFADKSADSSGTGIKADSSGTGTAADSSGTGVAADSSGTGIAADSSGTGNLADSSGTGIDADSSGTGYAGDLGQFAFAVEIAVGCSGTEAIVYDTATFSEVAFVTTASTATAACGGIWDRDQDRAAVDFH